MSDTAKSRGLHIDIRTLSAAFGGIPVVEMVRTRGIALDELRATLLRQNLAPPPMLFNHGETLENEIAALQSIIEQEPDLVHLYPICWLVISCWKTIPTSQNNLSLTQPYCALHKMPLRARLRC